MFAALREVLGGVAAFVSVAAVVWGGTVISETIGRLRQNRRRA